MNNRESFKLDPADCIYMLEAPLGKEATVIDFRGMSEEQIIPDSTVAANASNPNRNNHTLHGISGGADVRNATNTEIIPAESVT